MTVRLTQTIINLSPDMASRSRSKAAVSAFRHANAANFAANEFSLYDTEPTQGSHSGQFWNQGHVEGSQYPEQTLSSPSAYIHDGLPASFNPYRVSEDSHEMSRQESIGGQSSRTAHSSTSNTYDQAQSARMYHSLSQVSYHFSSPSSDGTGSSHSPEYTPQPQVDVQNIDSFSSFQVDDVSGEHSISFHRGSASNIPSHLLVDPSFDNGFMTSENDSYMSTLLPHQVLFDTSPTLLDADFLDGQRTPPMMQDEFFLPPAQLISQSNSPLAYSPSHASLSPPAMYAQEMSVPPRPVVRAMKKTGPRQSKVNSDIARNSRPTGTSVTSEESFKYTGRTPDVDNNARVHELYHNAAPQSDGLYHCPWEGQETCQHRPEKLKCNYDKFVDSHLKPYRCKISQCENLQFSSTACLLRHEREAHAMHGHGEKPFLCSFEGCDRSAPGNGFPRHWNLRDHMRRVHNDHGAPKSSASSGSPPPSAPVAAPVKSKKRKVDKIVSPVISKSEKSSSKSERAASKSEKAMKQAWAMGPDPEELYRQNYNQLISAAQRLQDPRNPDNEQLFSDAYGSMQAMQNAAQVITSQLYG